MSSKLTFLMNAAVVGGLAGFAAHTVAPISTSLLPASVSEKSRSGIATRSVSTQTVGTLTARTQTAGSQTVTPPSLVRTGSLPGSSAAKTANLLSSSQSDAIVPPIVRRRPGSGAVNGQKVAAVEPASEKKSAKKTKAEKTAAKTSKPASGITGTVKMAAATPHNKQAIDLTGRSALGAAPKGVSGTASKGVTCNTGLKYDAKQLKCVASSASAEKAPKVVKVAAPAPAPASPGTAKP